MDLHHILLTGLPANLGVKSHDEAGGHSPRSSRVHLRQRRLGLGQPERHLHRLVHRDGSDVAFAEELQPPTGSLFDGPVLDLQARHLAKIGEIPREQERLTGEHNGRNLYVHGADP